MSITQAEFGSWQSPITTELLTSQTVGLSEPRLDGDRVYWLESRPWEKGRNALCCRDKDGAVQDLLPAPVNVRSKVHEYGGASYCVSEGVVYFSLFDDQRIYRLNTRDENPLPEAITAEGPWRYADFFVDVKRQQLLCVREVHADELAEPRNEIVAIPLGQPGGDCQVLVTGNDFYSNPCISPDGNTLSWLSWNHPNMPWDETECRVASIDSSNTLGESKLVAGGNQESVFQPQWSPQGELYFVSDRNNWWNIYRVRNGATEQVSSLAAEFATPQWVFGMSTYGFLSNDSLLCCYTQEGDWQLASINLESLTLSEVNNDYAEISSIACNNGAAVFLGAASERFEELTLLKQNNLEILRRAGEQAPPQEYLSSPQAFTFPVTAEEVAHGFYYAPKNKDFSGPADTAPPLIVLCHGGPTGATSKALNLKIQFWTSRGFAIFDVNYRGSTGYGRQYRDRLKDNWGICDVEDVCAGAEWLAEKGLANPQQMLIKGGSAGGYTVLAALTFRDTFSAGASHYGIGNLETLALETHKFEARYMDRLVGEYPAQKEIYLARSPINTVEQLNCPVIFFQGLDDKMVPPNQAETMVAALDVKGIPCAYVPFEGEGHGFRQGPNIKRALEGELYFYAQLFGFEIDSQIETVDIKNLETR